MSAQYINLINYYLNKYYPEAHLIIKDENQLHSDRALFESVEDIILDLFCLIGLDEQYEPNELGKQLDKCLEYLSELRYKFFNQ